MFKKILEVLTRYGIFGSARLMRDVALSRLLISPVVRVVRYPWYIRGKENIVFRRGFTSGVGVRLDAFGSASQQLIFGANVEIGDYVHIAALRRVILGDNCLLASKVYISDHDHGAYKGESQTPPEMLQRSRPLFVADVVIGDNVWLGENVVVLKGVSIGRNSIIAAGAVVTRDVPENCIAAGNPAVIIKKWDGDSASWISARAR